MNDQSPSTDFGTYTRPDTVVFQRWLPGPVERIWSYLVDEDKRALWLASGPMVPEPGAEFELVWRNDNLGRPGDRHEGAEEVSRLPSRVIAAEPPHRLVFAWGSGEVSFDLQPKGDRVLLTLTHTGLNDRTTRTDVGSGWHTHLDIFVAVASDQPHKSFWSEWRRLRAEYDRMLSA